MHLMLLLPLVIIYNVSSGLYWIHSGESASEGSSEEGSDANSQNVSTV